MSPADTGNLAPPRVIGHRGAAGHAPENTLAAIRAAHALGIGWVEFDVRLIADGRCVLLHDDTLDRTTDGQGSVDALDLEQVACLDAGTWFDPGFAGEPVPTLEEAIDLVTDLGLGANIELKANPGQETALADAVVQVIGVTWPERVPRPVISSFLPGAIAAVREAAPGLRRALLVDRPMPHEVRIARDLGVMAIHCNHAGLSAVQVKDIRTAGFDVLAYTVNHSGRSEELFGWGVRSVFSDFPDRVLASVPAGIATARDHTI